jgi:hypothetical protein
MITAWLSIMNAILALLLAGIGVGRASWHGPADDRLPGASARFALAVLRRCSTNRPVAHLAPERRVGRQGCRRFDARLADAVPVGFTMWRWMSMPYPEINDITTDYENPPEFVKPPNLSPTR